MGIAHVLRFTYILFLIPFTGLAQHVITGKVLNDNGDELSFCTIGVEGKNFGTVSDINGFFSISLIDSLKNDSLTFSYVGYETHQVAISSLLKQEKNTIILKENISLFDEIIVEAKRTKQIVFGYKKDPEIYLWIGGKGEGAEIASYISLNNRNDLKLSLQGVPCNNKNVANPLGTT